jgi:UDP-N-acetylmuramate--alanine ligase
MSAHTPAWPRARTNLLSYSNFYLVGIKGVAMTSIAQCLLDAGKTVSGSDTPESFVTQPTLDARGLTQDTLDTDFGKPLPENIDCVIYTSAHNAHENLQVKAAIENGIAVFSQAEAIASMANQKKVIAVCGVGGKSTVSAMITWIMTKAEQDISYSVGVGEIPGLPATGKWNESSEYFVIEADEYVTDPGQARTGKNHVPRFAYLEPTVIVCTNIQYDHPDVYRNFDHTLETYARFFEKLKPGGTIVYNADDTHLQKLVQNIQTTTTHTTQSTCSYGESSTSDWRISNIVSLPGSMQATVTISAKDTSAKIKQKLVLQLPGKYNIQNATAALAAVNCAVNLKHTTSITEHTTSITEQFSTLSTFNSTKRRAEYIGTKQGIRFYDDYAHHPRELQAVIKAFTDMFPKQRVVFAFQPHTYSRTKQLYPEFIEALRLAPELIITDIFASARETADHSVSSAQLASEVGAIHLHNNKDLASWVKENLKANAIFITLGAGDIYQVHNLI